jgi:type IV pilus biogenesis protein CpaD/CtpE
MKRNNTISKVTLAILMSLTLEGCEVPNPSEIPMPEKPYILKHETKSLILNFHGHSTKLTDDEKGILLSALKPYGPGKASVHLTIPNTGSRLGKQRLKNIIRTALEDGVKAKQIHRSNKLPPANGNEIEVVLDTYRAIPPLCPNWSTVYGSGYNRGNTSNFGCATAVDFLLMLEDPIVLFKGESALSRDAARDSLAIADYRAGKDKNKWLKVEKADNGASASSGSSGSSGGAPSAGGGQ